MGTINTFLVVNTRTRAVEITTNSARYAKKQLSAGRRIDIWNDGAKVRTVYYKTGNEMNEYIALEKEYVKRQQALAHERKERRRQRAAGRNK